MSRVLLDTNAVSSLFSGDRKVLGAVEKAGAVLMSVIVMGELNAGFLGGSQPGRNRKILGSFLEKPGVEVVPVSAETAEIFGSVMQGLRKAGTPLPINDVWIGCQALENGAKLVTYDRHFTLIPGVRVWEEFAT